jgi:PAS domain S-box-containing protein
MRILLAEDNADHRELMSLALTGHDSTWQVEEVASGEEALRRLAEEEAYDLVFLDYSLPGRDGLEVLGEIQRDEGLPPVVMVTGLGDEQVAVEAMKGGAYDYVVKGTGYLQRLPVVAQRAVEADQLAVERKQAEEALRKSEERFRSLVETTSDWIWEVDQNGIYTYASPKVKDLLGYEPEQVIGKTPFDLMPQDEAERIAGLFRDIVESREPFVGLGNMNLRKDGRHVVLETSGVPIFDASGSLLGYRGIDRDITERVRAEEALRESEERFRSLAKSSQDYIMLYDRECRHLYENPAALRVAGFTEEDIIGKTHREAGFDEQLCDLWEEKITEVFRTGNPGQSIFEWESAEGTVYLDWRLTPVLDKDGEVEIVLGISRDITEIKRVEEELRASLREKTVLLKEVHHRVKNNLQVIASLLDLQAESIQDPQVLRVFQNSQHRIRSMALIHETLYVSEDLARIDAAGYVHGVVNYLCMAYSAWDSAISVKVQVDEVPLDMDTAIPCGLIINELVSNALRHAFPPEGDRPPKGARPPEGDQPRGEGGEIRVELRAAGDGQLCLVVSDNGVGLPPDVDWQDPPSLGLQLIHMLTRQLRGTLALDGSAGTAFKITFAEPKA